MKVSLRRIEGPWNDGYALDKHTVQSIYVGEENGRPKFDTIRTEVGEATFQLKYRSDWEFAKPLAQAVAEHIYPKFPKIGLIVPMPASTTRPRQPVVEVAKAFGALVNIPVFDSLLVKAATGKSLKDLNTKEEKKEAIGNSISVVDEIDGVGPWNVLVIDDLFHTGASMEAACEALKRYAKIRNIYVAALTWR